ncbi:MAG: hypothetical protein R3A79_15180 [Nannocystaceae bacterium]
MSIPRRGSRAITVDGVRYRWRLRGRPTAGQRSGDSPLLVAIAADAGDGPALLVEHRYQHHPAVARARGHYTQVVTPAEVAAYVRQGIAAGWRPHAPGRPFTLEALQIGPQTPRLYPPGMAPPSRAQLLGLARERAQGRAPYDTLRVCAGDPQVYGALLEVNGRDFIALVRDVERPLLAAENAERRAAGEDVDAAPDPSAQYAGRHLGDYRLPSRLLLGEPSLSPGCYGVSVDDPARGKSALLACVCGIDECWFLLATITVLDDAVIWSDFEQYHRNWAYDLGPFVFEKGAYMAAIGGDAS